MLKCKKEPRKCTERVLAMKIDVKEMEKARSDLLMKAKPNIEAAQRKQKEYFDAKKAAPSRFNIGSLVLVKNFRRKKCKDGKFQYRWLGPSLSRRRYQEVSTE